MTLDKHCIDGVGGFSRKVMPASDFESQMKNAGYSIAGTVPAQGGRIKVWWMHSQHRRVEAIYSPDKFTVITAYHP
jgi:hypothetical protein